MGSDREPEEKLDRKTNKSLRRDDARVGGVLVKVPKRTQKSKRAIEEPSRSAKGNPKRRRGTKGVILDSEESESEKPSGLPNKRKYSFHDF